MRVLWITGNFYPQIGGLQVYTDRLINSLTENCEVGLVTEEGQLAHANPAVSHFEVANLTRPCSPDAWRTAMDDIRAAVRAFAPDLVHFANANVAVYADAVPSGIPALATVHGNDLTAPWQATPEADTRICIVDGLNRCDLILAVSNHAASLVGRWGVSSRVTVLTSGCDLEFFHPEPLRTEETRLKYGLVDDAPLVLTVGRLVPRKGHLLVLEALRSMTLPVYWLAVGKGSEGRRILECIEHFGLEDRVALLGEVSNEDLRDLYNACDVFVLTPEERHIGEKIDSEGFGLVFHEAGACGKAVIASDISGCKEAVFHGITGLVVPPGDPEALAESLTYLLSEPDLARSLGQGGLALVQTLGGWRRLASQLYELYELSIPSNLDVKVSKLQSLPSD